MRTVPIWLQIFEGPWRVGAELMARAHDTCIAPSSSWLIDRFDQTDLRIRKAAALALSIALHLLVLALLLYKPVGALISRGTTGEGIREGAGFTLDLVAINEAQKPRGTLSAEQKEALSEVVEVEHIKPSPEKVKSSDMSALIVESDPTKSNSSEAQADSKDLPDGEAGSGATGQNGQAEADLWSAIAPCWRQLSGEKTLSVVLNISFGSDGGLSAPPVIERDPKLPITEDSLKSEATALAALSQCGPYPMAQGQQGVVVQFLMPGQTPSGILGNQSTMSAVQP